MRIERDGHGLVCQTGQFLLDFRGVAVRADAVSLEGVRDFAVERTELGGTARAGYAGLYIELKVVENRPSNNQKDWLEKLTIQGYQALVCYGGNEAIRALEQYVTAPKTVLEMREGREGGNL